VFHKAGGTREYYIWYTMRDIPVNNVDLSPMQKRMRVKRLPTILALHLKRFKYMEQMNRFIKVSHRVVFPLELRLFNTSDDAENPDRMYDLVAVVIHCGSGPNRGHYISIVKSCGLWLIFDDDIVDVSSYY
jgi:ubiquitin carboxyl-terminal hydrolase 12/46